MRDHTKLKAFELADKVVLMVYQVTAKFPKEEVFGLISQMRRAAVSVPSNLVEGCARSSYQEYTRFIEIAFSSLKELQYQGQLAHKLGFMAREDFQTFDRMSEEAAKVLGSLLRALQKDPKGSKPLPPSTPAA